MVELQSDEYAYEALLKADISSSDDVNGDIVLPLFLQYRYDDFVETQQDMAVLPEPSDNTVALDSANLWTFLVAITLIVYGCFRSVKIDQDKDSESSVDDNKSDNGKKLPATCNVETLDASQAMLLPLGSSLVLLAMFYFFDSLQVLFTLCTGALATIAFAFLLFPLCRWIISRSLCSAWRYSAHSLAGILAFGTLCVWMATGHWLLMDALGMGLSVAFITLIRLPSLKVSTVLLTGLLIYDLFWVFLSPHVFNANVMMNVATRLVDSPLGTIVNKFNHHRYDDHQAGPKLSLPGKLIIPSARVDGKFSMLGIGDIILPGLLLCFLLRYDTSRTSQLRHAADMGLPLPRPKYQRIAYFHCALVGYFLGLLTATLSARAYDTVQPALLYVVPFTLLPLLVMAYYKGDLKRMWSEPFQQISPSPQCHSV